MIDEFFAARILVFEPRDYKHLEPETVEIIDLIDPNFKKIVKTSWNARYGSLNGIIGNQPFLFCGDWQNRLMEKVMILNKKKEMIKLETPRESAAICKISQNSYLIFGGRDNIPPNCFGYNNPAYDDLASCEIIEFKTEEDKWIVRKGMDLPLEIWGHSAVKWDENTIYIIGGICANLIRSDEVRTWILDMKGGYRQGPSLNIPRLVPDEVVTAAIITSNGKRKIIAAHQTFC